MTEQFIDYDLILIQKNENLHLRNKNKFASKCIIVQIESKKKIDNAVVTSFPVSVPVIKFTIKRFLIPIRYSD